MTPTPAALARQDTIDETNEDSKSLRRQAFERQVDERESSGVTHREQLEQSSLHERETISIRTTSTAETYDNGLREQHDTLAQRDLIATVLDMKVDSRHEMQRLSQRIGRLEDLLTELVKRLAVNDSSDLSTPADEMIPAITTTFVGSPTTSSTSHPTNIIVSSIASTSAMVSNNATFISTMQQSSSSGETDILNNKRIEDGILSKCFFFSVGNKQVWDRICLENDVQKPVEHRHHRHAL